MLDVTIVCPECPTHSQRTWQQLAKASEHTKHTRYDGLAAKERATFIPLVMDTYGKFTRKTLSFIRQIAKCGSELKRRHPTSNPLTFSATITLLSKALNMGNGYCLMRSYNLQHFGMVFSEPAGLIEVRTAATQEDDAVQPRPMELVGNPGIAEEVVEGCLWSTLQAEEERALREERSVCDVDADASSDDEVVELDESAVVGGVSGGEAEPAEGSAVTLVEGVAV